MNLFEARQILELPDTFDQELIKKNYHRLAIKYHPDKCKDPDASEKFMKLNEAHQFLNNPVTAEQSFPFADLFKVFNAFNFPPPVKINKTIEISIKDYFVGTTKQLTIQSCDCPKQICKKCNKFNLSVCIECLGDGYIKTCSCFKILNFIIPPKIDLSQKVVIENTCYSIKINDPGYSIELDKVYYKFDITFKESIIGFNKTFKDYLDTEYSVKVKNKLIQQNDGYLVGDTILLFNIIYPKIISKESIKLLSKIDF